MARTSVNVIGNCLASAVIARWKVSFLRPVLLLDSVVRSFFAAFR